MTGNCLRGVTFPPETIDDLLRPVDPIEHPFEITFFENHLSKVAFRQRMSLCQLEAMFHELSDDQKSDLPMVKLAIFGDRPTNRGSLRNSANLLRVSGIEGDHDQGSMTISEAKHLLDKAGVAAFIHTTPSHSPSSPRWRVLAPLSVQIAPEQRYILAAKLNGILKGALAEESFTPSQSFYFGKVAQNPDAVTAVVPGQFLDYSNVCCPIPLGKQGEPLAHIHEGESQERDEQSCPSDKTEIARALGHIPIQAAEEENGYHLWVKVGMALHSHFEGNAVGLNLWDGWSRGGKKYDQKALHSKWKSFSADRENLIGIRSLFHIARDHGWRDAAPGFQPPITILSPDDCREIPHAGYVIKGIIAPQNLVCIFGKPGAGKSVLAPHLAYAVAQGRDVFGLRVRSGGVLYVPAEDVSGMKQRIKALRENHGPAEQFGLVDGISDLFNHDSGHLQYLKAAIEERKPSLVVIDTLAAAFPGLQENDSADMGRVVGTARSICELGPAVVLVHHDVKNGGNTPRGHSILNGALESSMRLERSSTGIIKGKLEKNKNGSQDIELCFQIYGKDLGLDDDGDKITAPCAREVEGSDPDLLMGLSRSAHAVLRAFKTIEALEEEASRSELLEQAMADPNISESTDPANRRKNASRGLKVLLDRGILYQLKNDIIVDGTKHDGFDA